MYTQWGQAYLVRQVKAKNKCVTQQQKRGDSTLSPHLWLQLLFPSLCQRNSLNYQRGGHEDQDEHDQHQHPQRLAFAIQRGDLIQHGGVIA